jgi:hypothetical protein
MLTPARRGTAWPIVSALAVLFTVCLSVLAGAQDAAPDSCNLETPERIVAVADVHGGYDRFVGILRTAGLIDNRERWAGGRAVFVQTGDVLDRGPDSRRAMDLIRRLSSEAARAGGRVHALLGNHEVMRMLGDLRYVSSGEYTAFRSVDSETLRDRYYTVAAGEASDRAKGAGQKFDESAFRKAFLGRTPLGWVEMQLAFGPKGDYGQWLRERDTMVRINGIVFVHGGISPAVAALGCAKVNATVRSDLAASGAPRDAAQVAAQLSTGEEGPLWYRGLALNDESTFAPDVEAILRGLNARAIVVGHTVTASGRVVPRFGGRVIQLDTGMLGGTFYPSGRASALEIRDGRFTAIYEDRRDELPSAGRGAAPAPAGVPQG